MNDSPVTIPDNLLCIFTGEIEEIDDSAHLSIPETEVDHGDVSLDETYKVAIYRESTEETSNQAPEAGMATPRTPPVEIGDTRTVTIEGTGRDGDGVAKVERGFVVFVPGAREGEEVEIEITDVAENFAFGQPTGQAL